MCIFRKKFIKKKEVSFVLLFQPMDEQISVQLWQDLIGVSLTPSGLSTDFHKNRYLKLLQQHVLFPMVNFL